MGTRSGWATQEPSNAGLALLVLTHLGEGALVDLGVPPARNERRHASDSEGTATVAGGDEEVGVGPHHRCSHRDRGAIRENEIRTRVPERLDHAEQIVLAAGVEPGRVVSQLEKDLPHLEGRRDRLDEHGGANGAHRDSEELLRILKCLVPEPRLEVAFGLRR